MNKHLLTDILILMGLCTLVCLFWRGLEVYFYGYATSRRVDNLIGSILSVSLFLNYKFYKKGKEKEKK